MITGYLQKKKDLFYVVLHLKDAEGHLKKKWISTGLHVKGNKKKAEALLFELRKKYNFDETVVSINPTTLFSDFLSSWLDIVQSQVEATTFLGYSRIVKNSVIPYFQKEGTMLADLSVSDIQNYYQYLLTEREVSPNTVLHHHANIHKALKYAVKAGAIPTNPADRVERPQKEEFVGSFYSESELKKLFDVVKDTSLEYPVTMAAFYGLRRNEVVGLRWSSIDFDAKTITIENTVDIIPKDGVTQMVAKSRAKTKSSRRTLPLVPDIENLLRRMKKTQEDYRLLCRSSYCKDFKGYVYVNEIGKLVSPDSLSAKFKKTLKDNNLRVIRFHDLRHTYATNFDGIFLLLINNLVVYVI